MGSARILLSCGADWRCDAWAGAPASVTVHHERIAVIERAFVSLAQVVQHHDRQGVDLPGLPPMFCRHAVGWLVVPGYGRGPDCVGSARSASVAPLHAATALHVTVASISP